MARIVSDIRISEMVGEQPRPAKAVQRLEPYDAVSSMDAIHALPKGAVPLKLDWNESTIAPSPKVIDAITQFLTNTHHLNWYPDLGAERLRTALGYYTSLSADHIMVTNGSDDALDLVCRTYLDHGDDALVAWPTYGHFMVFAKARGVEPRPIRPANVFDVPTAAIMAEILPTTRLVYLASPNNPTGIVVPPRDVRKLCQTFPSTLFLVDEAYFEFSGVTSAPLVESFSNLVVTRTFSKCFGIAGLRVGYLMAGDSVMTQLKKLYNPKSVNALGQVGAIAALTDRKFRDGYIAEVHSARTYLGSALIARGAEVRVTDANFVLIKVNDPKIIVKKLEDIGVFIRDRSHLAGFEGYARITVGTMAQMKDLVGRIDRLIESDPDLLS